MVPSSFEGWLKLVVTVYLASVVINTITRRVPALSQIQAGF